MWTGRLRTQRQAPVTYWQEYVETDDWYIRELVADVPPEELQAALVDEDFSETEVEDVDAARSDDSGGEDSISDDGSYELPDDDAATTTTTTDSTDADAGGGSDTDDTEASPTGEGE